MKTMTQQPEQPDEEGLIWEGTPEELEEWTQYVKRKAISFVEHGYSVEWFPDGNNWMHVYLPERSYARKPELRATVKFFNKPSEFGIDNGRISKLCVQLRSENAMAKVRGGPYEQVDTLFNYDRGPDVDRLNEHAGAKDLYDLIVRELN